MQRRTIVKGLAALALVPAVTHCGGGDDDDNYGGSGGSSTGGTGASGMASCSGIEATTSVDSSHSHSVCVPQEDIDAPPMAGAIYETTLDDGHTHSIDVSEADFHSLTSGTEVMLSTSLVNGHRHTVTLSP